MDYNFVVSKTTSKASSGSRKALLKLLKMFFPIFLLSTFLPFLLILTMKPSELKFFTQADKPAELRIWIEPETLIASPNEKVEYTVKAELDDESILIPTIDVEVVSTGNITFEKSLVSYKKPFRGEVVLGKVNLNTRALGTFTISIPKESINITAFSDPIDIITGSSQLIVR